jgi:tRNA pseudouridine55 synthase
LAVSGSDSVRLRSGNPILIRAPQLARLVTAKDAGGNADEGTNIQGLTVFLSTPNGEPIALAEVAEGELRPFRVFNLGSGTT